MGAQLSMKAVLPLAKSFVTRSCHSSNTGSCASPYLPWPYGLRGQSSVYGHRTAVQPRGASLTRRGGHGCSGASRVNTAQQSKAKQNKPLRPEQNGWHFTACISKCIILEPNFRFYHDFTEICNLECNCQQPSIISVTAWCRTGTSHYINNDDPVY